MMGKKDLPLFEYKQRQAFLSCSVVIPAGKSFPLFFPLTRCYRLFSVGTDWYGKNPESLVPQGYPGMIGAVWHHLIWPPGNFESCIVHQHQKTRYPLQWNG